jgi:hypothetical protein
MKWTFIGEDNDSYTIEDGRYNDDKCLYINSETEDCVCTIRPCDGGVGFSPIIETDHCSDGIAADVLLFGLKCWDELVKHADGKEGGE